jgi:hypothetical protein
MLSQYSWADFIRFILFAVPIYYLVIGLMYFRAELAGLFSGKMIRKKPPPPTRQVVVHPASVIGDFSEAETGEENPPQSTLANTAQPPFRPLVDRRKTSEARPELQALEGIAQGEEDLPLAYEFRHLPQVDSAQWMDSVNQQLHSEQAYHPEPAGEVSRPEDGEDLPWMDQSHSIRT